MEGNVALPITGMNGMWKIVTVTSEQVTMTPMSGSTPNSDRTLYCPEEPGYRPIGIVGWGATNGNGGTGMSFCMATMMQFDPDARTVRFNVRNMTNTGSASSSINKEGGNNIKVYVQFRVLYLRETEDGTSLPQPTDPVTVLTNQSANYGLLYALARYGRVVQVYINGKVNAAVAQWGVIINNLPKPVTPVVLGNHARGELMYLTGDGVLQYGKQLAKDSYIQTTFNYITATE